VIVDFEKFNKPIKTIVPILNGKFKYNGKRYNCNNNNSGWFYVELQGNECIDKSPVFMMDKLDFNFIKGYVFNEQFIFQSFEVGKRKTGKEVVTDIYLNTSPSFSSIIAVIWEDSKLYYFAPNYKDSFIYTVKNTVESNGDVKTLKGLTPELRTLCLFCELEKQRLEELKAEQEAEKLKKTLHGRLILAFRRTGAELLKYSTSGNRIIVDWKIGEQGFNSVINKDDFKVLECGYCCSGDDKRHNIHSMVNLAKDYDEQNLIYKTRER
jgi:hypothetical protein